MAKGKRAATEMDEQATTDLGAEPMTRLEEIEARIQEIGDPSAARLALGAKKMQMHKAHEALRAQMASEVGALEAEVNRLRPAEEKAADELAALQAEKAELLKPAAE